MSIAVEYFHGGPDMVSEIGTDAYLNQGASVLCRQCRIDAAPVSRQEAVERIERALAFGDECLFLDDNGALRTTGVY